MENSAVGNGTLETNVLDLMTTTLKSAGDMEQQRPSLYLHQTLSQTHPHPAHGNKAHDTPRGVKATLERPQVHSSGEQLSGKPGTSDPNSFPAVSASTAFLETAKGAALKAEKDHSKSLHSGNTSSGNSGSKSTNPNKTKANGLRHISRTTSEAKVTVEFYDEATGFGKSEEEKTSTEKKSTTQTAQEGKKPAQQDADKAGEETKTAMDQENKDSWETMRECRYIRGPQESGDTQMPPDYVRYVFGGVGGGHDHD